MNTWRPKEWENPYKVAAEEIIKKVGSYIDGGLIDQIKTVGGAYEAGADEMHKADIDWLIQRIIYKEGKYVFNMTHKEWQEFIDKT